MKGVLQQKESTIISLLLIEVIRPVVFLHLELCRYHEKAAFQKLGQVMSAQRNEKIARK